MSFMSPQQTLLERQMRFLLDDLDHFLEDKYGSCYPLHPNRPKRGKAARVAYDGLFSTGTKFTLGYGSEYGRGYIVDITISTLAKVNEKERKLIVEDGIEFLKKQLPRHFPNRKLQVVKDGNLYKIVGDFSLGDAY